MPRLVAQSEYVFGERLHQIRALLTPFASRVPRLQVRADKDASGLQVISATDDFDASQSARDRLFQTDRPMIFAQYFEMWQPDIQFRNFHLFRSYFHLFRISNKDIRDQLFCLHADPEEEVESCQGKAKAGPHFHILVENGRLGSLAKAHLPLCYLNIEHVLNSVERFDEALASAFELVREEILVRFE